MTIVIDDELLQESALTETDLKIEIAVVLFKKKVFTFSQARKFSGLTRLEFEKLLSEKKIGIYSFDDYQKDVETVNKLTSLLL